MLLLPLLFAALPADDPTPTNQAFRIPGDVSRPEIDGVLDEEVWDLAQPVGPLIQTVPVAGAQASEETDVIVAYDDTHLYVGLRCWDDNASKIRATQMARDANLDPDDRVELILARQGRQDGFFTY